MTKRYFKEQDLRHKIKRQCIPSKTLTDILIYLPTTGVFFNSCVTLTRPCLPWTSVTEHSAASMLGTRQNLASDSSDCPPVKPD